jgi:SAM-dependent methyltransferase
MRERVTRFARRLGIDIPPDEWGADGRVRFLDTMLPKGGVGAEVGVHKGRFTPVLLEVARPRTLHIIDPWYRLGLAWDWGAGDRSTVNALIRIIRRHAPALAEGSLVLHIGDDLEILPRFPEASFDWLYIDSSHAYEHTGKELRIAARLVRPDGVIAGDDWRDDPAHPHYGVRRAVEEFAAASDFRLVYADDRDRQWALRRG